MFSNRAEKNTNNVTNRVLQNFDEFRNVLRKGIELDESIPKHGRSVRDNLRVAEIYKEARNIFKKANAFNIMDIPENDRQFIREKRTQLQSMEKTAEERMLAICRELESQKPETSRARPTTSNTAPISRRIPATSINRTAILKGVDPKFGERLLDEILDQTGVRMDDVAGCRTAKIALEEAVILPALNPQLFSGLRQPVKGILLFGPPGNGKTLLAKAVAGDSKQTFFNISASSLTSKWVGDTEKTIRALFQIARNAQPSIIFIDEIDSILCERSEKDADVSRRMKTEFLVQFDGATSSPDDRILVIGATNRPYELDDAVLRRFPKRILLGLPDEEARYELVRKTLQKHNMLSELSDRDIRYVASRTTGYSNSDLVALCKEAAMVPIRGMDKSKLASASKHSLRPLQRNDFAEAMRVIRPSTSEKIMSKLCEFAKNFGC
ncbi:unnamed protein product [Caenorhabditis bovis]|uniref:microtubule-severing ATPase n=1 Tax=Caenorhabditis bovis TaxID=2654633 RepID=A0A8S1ECR9_9PELO|nr:unnamed protein product [Caenorhabditis bovis]